MVKNIFIKLEDEHYKKLKHLLVEYGLTWEKFGMILINHINKVEEIVKDAQSKLEAVKEEELIELLEEE